jgi:gliding motility-associated-like protein
VSNVLGPVTLTVPPFTMRAITSTNPTKCGFCDGVVKLYGLHPGQIDTITYNRNGIPQTPVVHTIGNDSLFTISGLCKGTYSDFVAKTAGVCVSNMLGPVALVDPPIVPAFSYLVHENCKGDTLLLTNNSTPASDLTYMWSFGDGAISALTNPAHIYYASGIYPIKLVITNTKCYDSLTQQLTLTNMVKAGFTESPDSFICAGRPVTFTNSSTGTQLNYLWAFGDGKYDSARNTSHIYKHAGTYNIVMALSNYVPCRDTTRAVITVDSIAAISISATDSVLCGGHSVTFNGLYTPLGSTGIKWTFDNNAIVNVNPIMHSFEDSGTFVIRLDAFYRACPDTFATKEVYIFTYPQLSLGPDTSICPGSNPIPLIDERNAKNPAARWLWSTGERTPGIEVVAPGYYSATVTIDGCHSSDTVWVKKDCYLDVPNAFTPNGDGANDYYLPRPLLARGLTSFKMVIFNRWGQQIFETTSTEGQGWDGKLNGIPQPEGVYIFKVDATFIDGQMEHHQGNITLLR